MKLLAPIIVKPEYYELIEKRLNRFWNELFYIPINQIIKKNVDFVLNDRSFIKDALFAGRIQYVDGAFSGSFNSKIVKEFNALGAVFDKRTGKYNIDVSKLPFNVQSIIAVSQAKFERANQELLDYIGGIDPELISDKIHALNLEKDYLKVTFDLEKSYQSSIRTLAIEPNMTQKIATNLADNYSNNMDLYIKNWTDENIIKLREEVYKNTFDGYRAENLVKTIQKNYNTSLSKAKFLAKQETSLLTSKFRQERYQDAGINEYKWRTRGHNTRKDHALLNGTTQSWNSPPITNKKTSETNHPGEDYNCFCTAIPIVRF